MKDAKQFLEDLKVDQELDQALGAAIADISSEEDAAAARVEAITAFAREHGYQFEAEDLSFQDATNREVSDEQLEMAAGGAPKCLGSARCFVGYKCPAESMQWSPE
ncbi:MAG: Nif11-like leader peptide family RiPP precursor [Coriobacteriia bacterium]|nr:Nif11-like leader peptide family RiPP precursor [Coriobacteriia bacterium]